MVIDYGMFSRNLQNMVIVEYSCVHAVELARTSARLLETHYHNYIGFRIISRKTLGKLII